jgi:pilus assembly protein CpaF
MSLTSGPVPTWGDGGGQLELIAMLRRQVSDRLAATGRGELANAEGDQADRDQRVAELVEQVLDEYTTQRLAARQMPLDPPVEAQVAAAVRDWFTGLGPLTALLADPRNTNIFINGKTVWVKRTDGSKDRLPPITASDDELIDLVRDIAARVGAEERRFDRGVPRVSIRLPDGSRLFATMSVSHVPSISIRRFVLLNAGLDELCVKYGAMDPGLRDLFTAMVRAKKNVVIGGGPDTGKTTMLVAFAKAIPPEERLVTIEDVYELGLHDDPDHSDCIAFQAREPNVEGQGAIDQAELVRWGLRMGPDRVILGEARGGEVVPLLNCMSQGNDGSLATIHTSSSRQAFAKLMTYAAQSAERLSFEATAGLVAGAVNFVVQLAWSTDKVRVISSVREVLHADGREVISNEIFKPGPDRRAIPATPMRTDTLDELVEAGFNPDQVRGW